MQETLMEGLAKVHPVTQVFIILAILAAFFGVLCFVYLMNKLYR